MTKKQRKQVQTAETEWTNARLVHECLEGNQEAWSALIDKYKNLIYSIPIKYGFGPDEAADVFQSVCLDLLSELQSLREPQALPSWLYRITIHKCFHLRRHQQHYVLTEDKDLEAIPQSEPKGIPEDMLREAEREQLLRDALSELTPRCHQLIHMLFFEKPVRPYQEVAARLGLATGSIGFIRRRCLELLRKRLEKLDLNWPPVQNKQPRQGNS